MKKTLRTTKQKRSGVSSAQKQPDDFPIVAIGASAGGLEAVSELFKHLSSETGMAFLYVQHLSPDHKSLLSSLLSKITPMKVQEATNREKMRPNHVYVIPPDKEMNIVDGKIKISPRPETPKINLPIDILFASLADTHKENVIGIILSGSATDGTRGIQAIKHEGGLTFAQDESAKFASMPKSAIASGAVDFILSPRHIAREISRLSKHPYIRSNGTKTSKEDGIEDNNPDLKSILAHLFKTQGVDFSQYKMSTVKRRILRRMLLYKINSIKEYATRLKEKPDESEILYQDLLINVTAFFRDNETHQYLKNTLLPKLLKGKKPEEPLRIWVPACSTGEEAYSLAISLLEIQGSKFTNIPVQIFATDLDAKAIAKARIGDYSRTEVADVSPKRLQRFYSKSQNGYRVSKQVRDMCVFAQHNVLSDPPFAHVDFISCCNLLIYLDIAAQKKAIATFHYALNENGLLMLGRSESIGQSTQFFTLLNKSFKIFQRKTFSGMKPLPVLTPRFTRTIQHNNRIASRSRKSVKDGFADNAGLDKAIDTVMLSRYMPASVIINEQLDILQFRGETDPYISPSTGRATLNVLKMTRPEIAFELRSAISKAIKSRQSVRKTGIELKSNDIIRSIGIEVLPLKIEWDEPVLLILFIEEHRTELLPDKIKDTKSRSAAKDRRIKKLETELNAARVDMLAFTQEQEALNEEMQSANEEVISSNEELQTINEELETSKEEIESANEELTTTNQELQTRNELLNESYSYSEAIINTIHESMVVLDKDLRVKSANKSFYRTFAIREQDAEGVLLYELGNKQWDIPALRQLLEDIIPRNINFHDYEIEHEFQGIGKKSLLLNASRIQQHAHHEQLILLSIADMTDVRRLQQQIQERELRTEKMKSALLEETVMERTKDLLQSNTELVKKNIELESFTYLSSHDLQEPLRKIQTFASHLLTRENENLSDTGKEYFHRMQDTAQRMQMLIQDLLTFSQLNASERKFERTDLTIIMEEVRENYKEIIAEKQGSIKVAGMCDVNIIPFQFRQLMENLIGNSLKFANPEIPPRILVKSEMIRKGKSPLPGGQAACHITVIDNGIGFEQQFTEKIFQIFQKLHARNAYPGTGIGLAIVKKIVENHNGIITAKSEPNKGATFDIYIPA